jgi:hypothetical protein
VVHEKTSEEVGRAAFAAGLELHELAKVGSDLEAMFFSLVSSDYSAQLPPGQQSGQVPPPGHHDQRITDTGSPNPEVTR